MRGEILLVPADARREREHRFAKPRITIGRLADNDVALPGDGAAAVVSRRHAELYLGDEGTLYVKDLGSRTGTWVNGARVANAVAVSPRDVIAIGEKGPTYKASVAASGPATITVSATPTGVVPSPPKIGADTAPPVITVSPKPKSTAAGLDALATPALRQSEMVRFVSDVVARERSKTLYLIVAVVAASLCGAVALIAWTLLQRSRDQEVIARLESKFAASEERVEKLSAEIADRDRELHELRDRQGISEGDRAAAIAETELKLAKLRDELRKDEELLKQQQAQTAAPAVPAPAPVIVSSGGAPAWADIVERYKESVFLCVNIDRAKNEQGFATAFVIADGVLATNAHVVQALKASPEKLVIQNQTGRVFKVLDLAQHPLWKDVRSPDVGLIKIDSRGSKLVPVPLATDDDLKKLRIGTQLGTLGFPGELASSYFSSFDRASNKYKGVIATFKDGWIGRITDYKEQAADFAHANYIQHSASLTGGTSGSPMFTADGKVVALNNASYDQQVVVQNPGAKKSSVVRAKSAAEISFAIRVDELAKFWSQTRW